MSILREIKKIIEPSYMLLYNICIKWFCFLPIKKNKIIFVQACGGGYRCNLKYIAEEIHRQQLQYDMVWLVNSMNEDIPQYIRKVKYNRLRAVWELSTAKVFINNNKSYFPVKKKSSQVFVYIPHGQPGCKCAEGDAILPDNYIKASKFHSSQTDIFVSMGTYHTQVLKDTFWLPETAEILECGFPRNDQYYRYNPIKIRAIRKKLSIPDDIRIAFYAPTFRDSGKIDAYNLDIHRVLATLEHKTGDRWMFFITLHNNFAWFQKPIYPFGERIWNMTSYTDIHELLSIADIAISDYSSVALDFANTRKPVFLYASDIGEYSQTRGLKDMYFKLPFTICHDNDEIENAIINFDKDEYSKKLEKFQNLYGSVDDGYASERFVERLKQLMK